uniref:Uncharacterized protein n=1 Tax=Ascaris lumbricoides TaxID=6252 RepID=A0A0M3HGI5_ASCLU
MMCNYPYYGEDEHWRFVYRRVYEDHIVQPPSSFSLMVSRCFLRFVRIMGF